MDLRFSRRLEEILMTSRHNPTLAVPLTDQTTLLLYADSQQNADMRYFSGLLVPDAFVAIRKKGKKIGIFNALEYGRALKQSTLDEVVAWEPLREEAKKRWPAGPVGPAEVIMTALKAYRITQCVVADDFPAGLFQKLKAHGLAIEVASGAIFPAREFKSPAEAKAVRAGNAIAAAGIAAAEEVLKKSRIKGGKLFFNGSVLTSERVKFAIETACLETGGVSLNTIAAGGNQACDPHDRGSGPLRANELIIIDVFPRAEKTGYHGDMTRTFLKGRASDAQRALVEAVRQAQLNALKLIRNGVNGRDVHRAVAATFTERGFETKTTAKGSVGFFHGTGHGLGLAVHELPRVSGLVDYTLKTGAITTVEPGLYYPGLGGCRIEDVVQVSPTGYRPLSSYHYAWEIR